MEHDAKKKALESAKGRMIRVVKNLEHMRAKGKHTKDILDKHK